jgi:hypothetical protein
VIRCTFTRVRYRWVNQNQTFRQEQAGAICGRRSGTQMEPEPGSMRRWAPLRKCEMSSDWVGVDTDHPDQFIQRNVISRTR